MKRLYVFKYVFVLLCGLAILVSSCRDNEENPIYEDTRLNGFWQPYKLNQAAVVNGSTLNQMTELTICQQKTRILFNNGTGSTRAYVDNNGTCEQQAMEEFTYDYNAETKVLTIKNASGETQSGTVKELTENELIYEMKGTFDLPGQPNLTGTTTIYARRTKD